MPAASTTRRNCCSPHSPRSRVERNARCRWPVFAAKLDDLPPRLRYGFVDPFVRAGARPFEFGDLPVELGQVLAERFDEVVHSGPPRFEVLGGEFALALESLVRLGAFLPEAGLRLLTELVIAGLQRGQCDTVEAFFQRLADGFQLPGTCFVRFLEPRGFGAGFREWRLDLCRGLAGFPPFADAIFFHRGDALVALLNRRLGTGQRVVPLSHVVAQSVAFARDCLDDGGARRGVVGPPDEAPDGDEEPRTQQGEDDEGDFHTRMSGSGVGVKMPGRDDAAIRPLTPGSGPGVKKILESIHFDVPAAGRDDLTSRQRPEPGRSRSRLAGIS